MKEIFVRWIVGIKGIKGSRGGTIKLSLNGSMFSFEKISGSSIDTRALVGLLWWYPPLEDFRRAAKECVRQSRWSVKRYDGMSGCETWTIKYLTKVGMIRETGMILHSSMYGRQNEDIHCWVRDIYDVLWHLKSTGYYPEEFEEYGVDEFGYVNITDSVLRNREEFEKNSYSSSEGFSSEGKEPVEEDEDEYV